ncbi:hypothetical protein [Vagococcus xieshaowenii]|uniref:DUF669 domain-containing protein n=1 Tax=Vagococcus xieshaowenii TaxID=2562451 RepID=A0AAJ5EFT7_9ENTE|nr:hypothetical protein [Vagococcus xieshaowenii]QCA28231.1 hypothetical protein E4Z98_02460 [Vagococcus xieshaowenii]TFZ41886.1 hypothetical protein E4031_04640 [Vagococcus xieshaowenii]
MNNEQNEFLDWNSGFIAEESQFTLLPAGDYDFTVTNMERKIYSGMSDKIPNGAPYAEVTIEVVGAEGKTSVFERLYLMKKMQWKLTEFFTSIGQVPVIGQPFNPNWNNVVGSKGRLQLEVNSYVSKGENRQNNRVKKFLKPNSAAPGQAQQTYQAPPVQQAAQQPMQQQVPPQQFNQTVQQQPTFSPGQF